MKKRLEIVIFLLTLLTILDISDASSISAQNLTYENGSYLLPDVEINGTKKVQCACCKEAFDDDEALNRHIKYGSTGFSVN